MRPILRLVSLLGMVLLTTLAAKAAPVSESPAGIPGALDGKRGDALRGQAIVQDRQKGLCLLCHSGPFPTPPFQGNLAPSLEGAGSRYTEAHLRQRMVDGRAFNPETIMPAYGRVEGLSRVAPAFRDKALLSESEIEDVIAYLVTLK